MKTINKNDVLSLIEHTSQPCLSLYMPAHRSSAQAEGDVKLMKNLISIAQEKLKSSGVPSSVSDNIIKKIESETLKDADLWIEGADGVAVFASPDYFNVFQLPRKFPERAEVDVRFVITPLVPLLISEIEFHVLALSINQVRLYQCTPYSIEKIELPNAPNSLKEFLQFDETQKQMQYRTITASSGSKIMHGHGPGKEDEKEQLKQYCMKIDNALVQFMNSHKTPLVVASTDTLWGVFHDVSKNSPYNPKSILGNYEHMNVKEIKDNAWKKIESDVKQQNEKLFATYKELEGTGKTQNDIRQILPSAMDGRVNVLFAEVDKGIYGRYEHENQEISLSESRQDDDEDLLNLTVSMVLKKSGNVIPIEGNLLFNRTSLAAILRY